MRSLFVFLFCLSYVNMQAQWSKSKGFYGGHVTAMAAFGNKMYAAVGASKSSLYTSNDSGYTWKKFPDKIFGLISCMTLNSAGKIVIGGNMGVQFSDNDGQTWQHTDLGSTNIKIIALLSKDSIVYAASYSNGLYKISSNTQVGSLVIDSLAGLGSQTFLRTIYSSGDTILLGSYSVHMIGSYDKGQTWKNIATMPEAIYSISNIGQRWFAKSGNHLYYTDDMFANISISNLPKNFDYYGRLFSITSANQSDIYLGGPIGVCKSADQGINWLDISSNLTSKNVTDFLVLGNTLKLATAGGIYQLDASGNQWTKKSFGIEENQVTELLKIGSTLLAATQSDGIHYSDDLGLTWNQSTGIYFGSDFITLSKGNSTLFCMNNEAVIYRSFDEGHSWTFYDSSKIYNQNYFKRSFLYSQGLLYTSDNIGRLWAADTATLVWNEVWSGKQIVGLKKEGNKIYASMKSDGLYVSDDGGYIWNRLLNVDFEYFFTAGFDVKNQTIIVGNSFGNEPIYFSHDLGKNWIQTKANSSNYSVFIGSNDTTYVAGKGLILKTKDGKDWIQEKIENTGIRMDQIPIHSFYEEEGIQVIGTDSGIFTHQQSANGIKIVKDQSRISVYPNPFIDIVKIALQGNSIVKFIWVANELGQEVRQVSTNADNIYILSDLPTGMYIFTILDSEGNLYHYKLLKQ